MSTVQTYIPRAVADALPIQGIAAEARGAGIDGATLQYSNTRWRPAEVLVTCQMPVARYLLARLRLLARDADAELVDPAKRAVTAIERGIADAYSPDGGPAEGIRSTPH